MNADLERLICLQETEQEISRLQGEISALPRRVAAIEGKLAETKAQVEKAKAVLSRTQSERRRLEVEIQSLQQKISKYRDQSLAVKTNDQYRALLQEIQFAENEIRVCEDKILHGMIETESQEKTLKGAESELQTETAQIESEKAEERTRTAELQKQLAEATAKRDVLRKEISADALRHYERVVKLRGSGVSEARQQICTSCRVMLRPQTYNEVKTNQQIIACESCGRILFYDPSHEPEVAEPKSRRRAAEQVAEEPSPAAETPAAQ